MQGAATAQELRDALLGDDGAEGTPEKAPQSGTRPSLQLHSFRRAARAIVFSNRAASGWIEHLRADIRGAIAAHEGADRIGLLHFLHRAMHSIDLRLASDQGGRYDGGSGRGPDAGHGPGSLEIGLPSRPLDVSKTLAEMQRRMQQMNADEASPHLREMRQHVHELTESTVGTGLVEESRRLNLPDFLAGVGYPGNSRATGVAAGTGIGLDDPTEEAFVSRQPSLIRSILSHFASAPRVEWCFRVGLSAALSMVAVLHPSTPSALHNLVWLPVLAIASAKPTLGDTLEGWWIAASGGAIGYVVALPLTPLAASSHVFAALSMVIGFGIVMLFLGEHVQARWALLPLLTAMLQAADKGNALTPLRAALDPLLGMALGGLCATLSLLLPIPCLASQQAASRIGEAYRQAARLHAILSVAHMQCETPTVLHNRASALSEKLQGSLHNLANLTKVARWEYLLLHHSRRAELHSSLLAHTRTLLALAENLQLRNARRDSFSRGALHAAVVANSAAVAYTAVRHSAYALQHVAAELLGEPLPHGQALRARRVAFKNAQRALDTAWAVALTSTMGADPPTLGSAAAKWAQSDPPWTQPSTATRRVASMTPLREAAPLFEAMWLLHEYHELLLNLPQPLVALSGAPNRWSRRRDSLRCLVAVASTQRRSETITSCIRIEDPMPKKPSAAMKKPQSLPAFSFGSLGDALLDWMRLLTPGAFSAWGDTGISRVSSTIGGILGFSDSDASGSHIAALSSARLVLAARGTLMLVFSATLYWMPMFSAAGTRSQWVPSDLVGHLPIFCPITVIFIYQSRTHTLIFKHSRMWRWLLGTYVGCLFALFFMYVSDGQRVVLGSTLTLLAAAATYVHADASFGYAGLVAGFTAPIIAVGYDWTVLEEEGPERAESYDKRALARLSQSFIGCGVAFLVTMLWQTSSERARPLLQRHMTASMNGVRSVLRWLALHGASEDPAQGIAAGPMSESGVIVEAARAASRRLSAEIDTMTALLDEAKAEPSIYPQPPFPTLDYDGALRSLGKIWQRTLFVIELSRAPASGESAVAYRMRCRFFREAATVFAPIEATLVHMLRALQAAREEDIAAAITPAMYDLQAELERYWSEVDAEWGAPMEKLLEAVAVQLDEDAEEKVQVVDESAAQVVSGRLATRDVVTQSTEAACEEGAQPRETSRAKRARHAVLDYLVQATLLAQLRHVGEAVSNLAWRLANIIEKEHPQSAVIPEPNDLYRFEMEV